MVRLGEAISPNTHDVFGIIGKTRIEIIQERQVGDFDVGLVINGSEPGRVNLDNGTKTKVSGNVHKTSTDIK
jgi:hypothetical protein